MRKLSKSLSGALTEYLILSLLHQKPGYGYEIIKTLAEITNEKLSKRPGSIYPVLSKMEQKGLIKSKWDMSNERPRRTYTIQKKGIAELKLQQEDWNLIVDVVGRLNE